jgi:hypothetical protein
MIIVACAPDYVEMWRGRWQLAEFGNDFHLWYAASYMAARGDDRCYVPPVIDYYCMLVTGQRYHAWTLYQTPAFILGFIPFTWLDYFSSTMLFLVLDHILLLASVALICAALHWGCGRARLAIIVLWFGASLLYAPVNDTLVRGQLNILVLFMVSLFMYCWMRGRAPAAALALGAAVLTKIIPGILLLAALLRRQYRLVALCLANVVLLSLVALAAAPALSAGYVQAMVSYPAPYSYRGLPFPTSQSWPSVMARYFFPEAGTPGGAPLLGEHAVLGTSLIFAGLAIIWGLVGWGLWNSRDASLDLLPVQIGLLLCGVGVGVPYNWLHHHTWLLLSLVTCWYHGIERNRMASPWGGVLIVCTLSLFILDGPFYRGLFLIRLWRYYCVLWGIGAYATLGLLLLHLWLLRDPDGRATSTGELTPWPAGTE